MTTITASPAMQGRHAVAIRAIASGNFPPRLKKRKMRAPAKPATELRDPTPERAAHATDISKSKNPPFNSQINSAYQKFQKQLGPDAVMILDRLCELAHQAGSPRITASYSGVVVDQSYTPGSNLTERARAANDEFRRIWGSMPPEVQGLVAELVLELPIGPVPTKNGTMPEIPVVGDRHRSYAAIGRDLCGYSDDRRGMGATVGALRIISWLVREAMGGRVPARRLASA